MSFAQYSPPSGGIQKKIHAQIIRGERDVLSEIGEASSKKLAFDTDWKEIEK